MLRPWWDRGEVRVAQRGRYGVYVYAEFGERPHLPHCHVRWPGESVAVRLDAYRPLIQTTLPAEVDRLLRDYAEAIADAWDRLNPERSIR